MIETGTRVGASASDSLGVRGIFAALGYQSHELDALADLWHAVSVPFAFDPRLHWAHSFPSPSSPIWCWIHSAQGPTHAHFRCSEAISGSVAVPGGGLILRFPISVTTPPVQVTLESEGWVMFGRGNIPRGIAEDMSLGIVDGRKILAGASPLIPGHAPSELHSSVGILETARRALVSAGVEWTAICTHLDQADPRPHPVPVAALPLLHPSTSPREGGDQGDHSRARTIREAMGLSRPEAIRRASELAPTPTAPTVRDLEAFETGTAPVRAHLCSRLDMVYRADGWLGIEPQPTDRIGSLVTCSFPSFWVGPVWVKLQPPRTPHRNLVVLRWGDWQYPLVVDDAVTLTLWRSEKETSRLEVRADPGWLVSAGTGAHPDARDVNVGWRPTSAASIPRLIYSYVRDLELRQGR